MIFFDIDNTLLDHDHAMAQGAAVFLQEFDAVFPISKQAFTQQWVSLADQAYRHYLQGDLSLPEARIWRMQRLFKSVGAHLSPADALDLAQQAISTYAGHWRLYPDVRPCLERLAGLPLGIISNGDAQQQREKLAAFNLAGYFTIVCISSERGAAKPDAAIFQNACAQTGIAIGECVYVGDQLDQDARAAAQAGMSGIWLNRGAGSATPAELEQVIEINSLERLPDILFENRNPVPTIQAPISR